MLFRDGVLERTAEPTQRLRNLARLTQALSQTPNWRGGLLAAPAGNAMMEVRSGKPACSDMAPMRSTRLANVCVTAEIASSLAEMSAIDDCSVALMALIDAACLRSVTPRVS